MNNFKRRKRAVNLALGREIARTPEHAEREDERLKWVLYSHLLREMATKEPITRRFFVRDDELKHVLEEVVKSHLHADAQSFAMRELTVLLEAYDDVLAANGIIVGEPVKWSIFARVSTEENKVSVYVPKTKEQMRIENAIRWAIEDLEDRFGKVGGFLGHHTRAAIEVFLWKQRYSRYQPNIRINWSVIRLTGTNVEAVSLPNGGVLQLYYDERYEILTYHVIR